MMPVLVTPPAALVVSLDEAKSHMRAEGFSDDNTVIAMYVDAATKHLDGWTGILGRCLINQEWRVDLAAWPRGCFALPFPNVSGASIVYFDEDDVQQDLPSNQFEIVTNVSGSAIRFKEAFDRPALNRDRADAVQVTFTAGYGADASSVPSPLKVAILLLAANWYENRESVAMGQAQTLPLAVDRLITPYRMVFF